MTNQTPFIQLKRVDAYNLYEVVRVNNTTDLKIGDKLEPQKVFEMITMKMIAVDIT